MIYLHILTCGRVCTCIWICVYILQVLACFVQVIPANSLHSTSSRGKSIAEGIIDLLSDNHWLTGTEVKVQCVRGRLQETAALCRTPDTVRTSYIHQLIYTHLYPDAMATGTHTHTHTRTHKYLYQLSAQNVRVCIYIHYYTYWLHT